MKKTFLARRNAILSPSGVPAGALLLGVVILLAAIRLLFPSVFDRAFAPVFAFGDTINHNTQAFITGFKDSEALSAANQDLVSKYADLALQNRTLLQQNADLKALLGTTAAPAPGVVAGVLLRPPESPYDTLLLGGGPDQGITAGMEAFGVGGVPVGAVTAASGSFSRVTLFSAPGTQVEGWVGKNRIPVTLYGKGGGAFTAELPATAGAVVGDTVFIPGPGALPIGTIVALANDASSALVTLHITPFINPFSITMVHVVNVGKNSPLLFATSTAP